jgi:hypothetical protein
VPGVVLLVLLIAIVTAGCGGGSTRTVTQVETKADFIALGDVICRNHQSRTKDLESQTVDLGRLDSKGKAHRVAELFRQQGDNLAAEADELQARQPPPADVNTVGSMLGLVRDKADLIGEWARAYDDLDTAEIRALQLRIGVATAKARDAARAYGFEVCGQE